MRAIFVISVIALGLVSGCAQPANVSNQPSASVRTGAETRAPGTTTQAAVTTEKPMRPLTPAEQLGEATTTAIRERNSAEALRLIDQGVDPNYCSRGEPSGYLLYAATFSPDGLDVAKALVARGADPNRPCTGGTTPTLNAAGFGGAKMVEFLISSGGDPNVVENGGFAALHCAVEGANRKWNDGTATLKVLLDHGANINAVDKHGLTPVDLARRTDVEIFLRSHGGKPAKELHAATQPTAK